MTNRFNMVCLLVDFCENWPTLRDGRIYCNLDRVGAYTPQYVHVVARIIAELYEYIARPTAKNTTLIFAKSSPVSRAI